MNFDTVFVNPNGRTSRGEFVPALITLVAVIVFYWYLVPGRSGLWSLSVLIFPAVILHARRLHDIGHSAWLLVIPAGLMIVAFAIWLQIINVGAPLDRALPLVALAVSAAFALWGCFGKEQSTS